MNIQKAWTICALSLAVIIISFGDAAASNLFMEDFEGDLSQWTGQYGGAHHGAIVDDPLVPGNHVLIFTELNAAGDIFTIQQFNLITAQLYRISFDYLGRAGLASIPGDFGGFAGISEYFPGRHIWYYGTSYRSGALGILTDDGHWHSLRL